MADCFYSELSSVCRYRPEVMTGKQPTSILRHFNIADFDNSIFKLDVSVEGKRVNVRAILKESIAVELFSIRFKIPKNGLVASINRLYNVSEIGEQIWNNGLTPLFIRFATKECRFLLYNSWRLFSHKVINHPDFFELIIFIDAAAEHPCWNFTQSKKSIASPVLHAGTVFNLEFGILSSPLQTDNIYPTIVRYPYGADAAFIITDHCDFDDYKKLNVFLHGNADDNGGWLGKGLKMTKGIFAQRSTGVNAKTNDTLETPEYNALIKELYADGSEIAAHALNQSGQITSVEFLNALDAIQSDFKPKTWIDHGLYLDYCYYMGGKNNPHYRLIEALKEKNYTGIWSYQDVPVSPAKSLNHFYNNGRERARPGRYLKKILRGKFSAVGHDLKSFIQRRDEGVSRYTTWLSLASSGRSLLMNIKLARKRRRAAQEFREDIKKLFKRPIGYLPYSREELINFSPALYLEAAKPLHQMSENDLVMFATQEITQLRDVYTEQALEKLIEERGLHVAHTYILNDLSYVEGVFEKGRKYQLCKYWVDFVNALSLKVKNEEVWNPTFSELVDHVKKLFAVSLEYIAERKIIVRNTAKTDVEGLTFCFESGATDANAILWNQTTAHYRINASGSILFWGNVPANSQVIIEWQ